MLWLGLFYIQHLLPLTCVSSLRNLTSPVFLPACALRLLPPVLRPSEDSVTPMTCEGGCMKHESSVPQHVDRS